MSPPTLVTPDAWLGDIMGRSAFRVSPGVTPTDDLPRLLTEHAHAPSATVGGRFYYAKVEARRIDIVRALSSVGFFVADVNVTFELSAAREFESVGVRECRESDEEAVCAIAGSAFEYTRFHLDPAVSRGVADEIKRAWVRNCVRKKRGDHVFVAERNGQVAAFLTALVTETDGKRAAVIDLVGVDRAHQRVGVGSAIVAAFIAHYRETCDVLRVGTQVANVPSIRLYERLGFSLCKSEYVLHRHVPG